MTKVDDKVELYALVALLDVRGWTPPTIGRVLGIHRSYVNIILADLGQHRHVRFDNVESALLTLDDDVVKRILQLRRSTMSTRREAESEPSA